MAVREKIAAVPIITGLLFCTSADLSGCVIGVMLLAAGALILNVRFRAKHRARRQRSLKRG